MLYIESASTQRFQLQCEISQLKVGDTINNAPFPANANQIVFIIYG